MAGIAVGSAVGVVGIWECAVRSSAPAAIGLVVAVVFGAACMLFRAQPGVALALVWFACIVQVFYGLDVRLVELGTAVVAFGCARYGSAVVHWLSGASIPVGTLVAVAFARYQGIAVSYDYRLAIIGLIAALVLALPWFLGLALRLRESSVRSGERQLAAEADRVRT